MLLRGVLGNRDVGALIAAGQIQRRNGGVGVFAEPLGKVSVAPGFCHHLGAVARPDLGLVGVDERIDRCRVDVTLLCQQRFESAEPHFDIGEMTVG